MSRKTAVFLGWTIFIALLYGGGYLAVRHSYTVPVDHVSVRLALDNNASPVYEEGDEELVPVISFSDRFADQAAYYIFYPMLWLDSTWNDRIFFPPEPDCTRF